MYRKLLVTVDGSKLAECALNHAETMVQGGFAREVTVLNVVKIDVPWAEAYNQRFDINKLREHAFALAERYLGEVRARLTAAGIAAETAAIESHRPAEAIADFAREKGMDLVVMATHGHTGMKGLMLGSVAQDVLHLSPVPVLLIRPEGCLPKD